VVRDITNILDPQTVATFDGSAPQFINQTDVSFVRGPALMRMSVCGPPAVAVIAKPAHGLYEDSYSWSPDGASVAYMTSTGTAGELHVLSGGRDQTVATVPGLVASQGCAAQSCADQSDIRLLYSPDGADISFVQNLGGPSLRIWSADGKVLTSNDYESAEMSAWSGGGLYFRDDRGVELWRSGSLSLLLPGVAWIRPRSSPAGGEVVFATRDSAGVAHVQLLDTATAHVREIAKSRSEPAFLNSHLIWYREERPRTASDPATSGLAVPTGKTYIFDLQDNTETESLLAGVFDVWPRAA